MGMADWQVKSRACSGWIVFVLRIVKKGVLIVNGDALYDEHALSGNTSDGGNGNSAVARKIHGLNIIRG